MPLYFHNGLPLFRNGGWAANNNCCCGDACSVIPHTLYLTIDGGNDCPGFTGLTYELNFDPFSGGWTTGPISICGGTGVIVLNCDQRKPSGTSLKDRLTLGVDLTCLVTPIGAIVPCTLAVGTPFYAEFSPFDIGPDWAECSLCCTGRETQLTFYVTA